MKKYLLALSALLVCSSSYAGECCDGNRLYIGGFGGCLYSDSTRIIQRGTAFFTEAEGGPLAVDARGDTNKTTSGFGGVQLGYEWNQCPYELGCSGWNLTGGVELEAYWYRHTKKGDLINPTDRLPEHDFLDTFPMHLGVYLFNGVFSVNHCSFSPYVGLGFGVAHISIHKATSFQVDPPEVGIDHFNTDRKDSSWTLVAQAKIGLRYNFYQRFHVFGEYRYVYLDSSRYLLGSTNYPGHAPTSPWDVDIKCIHYNAFAIGLQYDL